MNTKYIHKFLNLVEMMGKKLDDYIFRKWYNLKTIFKRFPYDLSEEASLNFFFKKIIVRMQSCDYICNYMCNLRLQVALQGNCLKQGLGCGASQV